MDKRRLTDTGENAKLSTGENVQKWTRFFLLSFPTRPSDEYDSQCRVENTRVHFWTITPVSVKTKILKCRNGEISLFYFWI